MFHYIMVSYVDMRCILKLFVKIFKLLSLIDINCKLSNPHDMAHYEVHRKSLVWVYI